MVSWSIKLELAILYPKWVAYTGDLTGFAVRYAYILKQSLLHQQVLYDLYGVYGRVHYLFKSYEYENRIHVSHVHSISIANVWSSAAWFEREVYELYGLFFEGSADMRRLLTDYGQQGYPMQPDFPVTGYYQYRYSERARRIVTEQVSMSYEFRRFDYHSEWLV